MPRRLIAVELTLLELAVLQSFLTSVVNAPDYWPGASGVELWAMQRVLSKVMQADPDGDSHEDR